MERIKIGGSPQQALNLYFTKQQLAVPMHPSLLSIHDFSYSLPESRIAAYPLPERDASRLLIYKRGSITEDIYRNVADHLSPDARLVFNNTRVLAARIHFKKPSGGTIEVFCLEPSDDQKDPASAMVKQFSTTWKCLIGGASKWKHGMVLEKEIHTSGASIMLEASIVERLPDSFLVEFKWNPGQFSFAEILRETGLVPLPPYIKRAADEMDKVRYQTIYADEYGSVAAPTAGLHFTPAVFEALKEKNIAADFLTLHVGAGTFKPVKSPTMEGHDMHTEFMEVELDLVERIASDDRSIFCVGSTSLRSLESLYWTGVKIIHNPMIDSAQITIGQWEVYDGIDPENISVQQAFRALAEWMKKFGMSELISRTSILIAPGYKMRVARGLITNFHQPQSTLLLLVAACIGEDWRKVYDYALANGFRFLSYGDGCLLDFER